MENKSGFTLIEIIISIVVFTLGVVGIMVVFYNTLGKTSNPTIRIKGIEIAQSVMDEILSKKFDNDTKNGGSVVISSKINIGKEESGDNTLNFDDVDDYNGLNCESGESGCFENLSKGYNIKVQISCAAINGSNKIEESSSCTNYKLITVAVKPVSLKEKYILKAVKGNF